MRTLLQRFWTFITGTWVGRTLGAKGFIVGLVSGLMAIIAPFTQPIYPYVAEAIYTDADYFLQDVDPVVSSEVTYRGQVINRLSAGYARSAASLSAMLEKTDFADGETAPFLFVLKVNDYRSAQPPVEEDYYASSADGLVGLSNGLLRAFWSAGCSQWEEGPYDKLILEFRLPGHEEAYRPGVPPSDPTRAHALLTGGWADNGEFVDLDGDLGERAKVFYFYDDEGRTFTHEASKWDMVFSAFVRPSSLGGGQGEVHYEMQRTASEADKLERTRGRAEREAEAHLVAQRGF